MSFAEKLKNARIDAGYTQEELAEKLNVSRAAVAKWESDRGMPDITNLKAIAQLLSVSLDYLLDDGNPLDFTSVKKAIDLRCFGDEGKLSRLKKIEIKEKIIRKEYPNDEIIRLTVTHIKNTKRENVADGVIGSLALFLGGIPLFGTQEFGKTMNELDQQYYLVNTVKGQSFVLVTDEHMISKNLTRTITEKKFEIGDREFLMAGKVD